MVAAPEEETRSTRSPEAMACVAWFEAMTYKVRRRRKREKTAPSLWRTLRKKTGEVVAKETVRIKIRLETPFPKGCGNPLFIVVICTCYPLHCCLQLSPTSNLSPSSSRVLSCYQVAIADHKFPKPTRKVITPAIATAVRLFLLPNPSYYTLPRLVHV